jgi:hypothetical protein
MFPLEALSDKPSGEAEKVPPLTKLISIDGATRSSSKHAIGG